MSYPFREIEKKWRKYWEENKVYSTDMSSTKPKYYNLCMFPYPSGDKLHLGHWFNYGPFDTHSRFMKMKGYNVLSPVGYDSFGLPTENYSLKNNIHPDEATRKNITKFTEQYKSLGGMYDWDHYLETSDPKYYKWTQWLFITLYKNGLAYQSDGLINYCPSCSTVVANSEVLADGTHERCGIQIERKSIKSWYFKTTAFAERYLKDLEKTAYPEKTRLMQTNWIGRSEGAVITFKVAKTDKSFDVFTTRPDTLYGATYCTLAPESPILSEIVSDEQREEVQKYIDSIKSLSDIDRQSTVKEKTGVWTGAYAVNPVNGAEIPIWISDYVLISYGTGAVMAVPAHDTRDFEFAKKFNIPIKVVIQPEGTEFDAETMTEAYTEEGIMVNSAGFDGTPSGIGIKKVIDKLEKNGSGKSHVTYKLRDWSVSRQRYWGVPIPIIYCDKCGTVPVPEKDLPVLLPLDKSIDIKPKGHAPLSLVDSYINTTCPECGGPAKRDAETMDTFVCSSWYYLRYVNTELNDKPFDKEELAKWLPVDTYIGGTEHVNGHMIYSRFVTKALYDLGYLTFDEPFYKVVHQGMITRDGGKMSKSKGNVVSPDEFVDQYGTDVFRMYMMFMTNYRDGGDWSDDGIAGVDRFVSRIWRLINDNRFENTGTKLIDNDLNYRLNYTIKEVTSGVEDFFFNTSIARMMELFNDITDYMKDEKRFNPDFYNEVIEKFVIMLHPFIPHITEEMWEIMGNKPSIFNVAWPTYDETALVKNTQIITVQVNGKVRSNITTDADIDDEKVKELVFADEKTKQFTDGKQLIKTILINSKTGKMVNLVVK
ncbi:MAG: leucine--tRNA ligase [Candidatus Delongbacteria bacterium]|jgi:leucyl-tRNA synthetase|nr:leucine--tRNA ligase [Candidatus Delongbacteria bacterium]